MVVMSATDGKILTTLPLAGSSDGAQFDPATMEAFSTHGNGTLTVVKEDSPTSFHVEQNLRDDERRADDRARHEDGPYLHDGAGGPRRRPRDRPRLRRLRRRRPARRVVVRPAAPSVAAAAARQCRGRSPS